MAQKPTSVMILGDSLTETQYRRHLYEGLQAEGLVGGRDFALVGARNCHREADKPQPDWHADHEGHGGFHTEQLLLGRWGQSTPNDIGLVKALRDGLWARFGLPDIVCLLTGTNDIGYDWGLKMKAAGTFSVPLYALHETIHDIRGVVAWLREQNPHVRVALSTGIPSTQERRNFSPGTLEALKDEIVKLVDGTYLAPDPASIPIPAGYAYTDNGLLRTDPGQFVSGGISTPDSPVLLVDHWTGFDTQTMLAGDQIHPSDSGEVFIGQRFARRIAPWLTGHAVSDAPPGADRPTSPAVLVARKPPRVRQDQHPNRPG